MIGRLGDADARTDGDRDICGAGEKLERRLVERETVMRAGDAERLAQPAGTGAQQPLVGRCRGGGACAATPCVGASARISTALALPLGSQTKLRHQWMP